ncbi:thiol:disulfide interchange protein DsbA/DsbL [Aquariibacter lacus]|uniref:thiol:disulfide interchange protein DsbA/DsbL n=1 Tax=Aquariibacter lacus TaxID=2801332 RepID=UPI002573B722|nr:thiol:disulfide interchange protein DsbA/DsbL [Piscinibacter lacus]
MSLRPTPDSAPLAAERPDLQRRQLAAGGAMALAALGLGLGGPEARAQGGPVEGRDYVRLPQRQPTSDPARIEVVEFFWYGCPHCYHFEAPLEAWLKKLPADVSFRRAPVAFREVPFVTHQKLFYALEALGQLDALHGKIFAAMHVQRNPLATPDVIFDFVAKNGVDRAKFIEAFNSFGVAGKARQAAALSAGYRIDGTPALGVNGQFYTSGSMAGTHERALAIADWLIGQSRKRG